MSEFSKYFNELKDNRSLTTADVAEKLGVEKSVVWNWHTGKYLPSSWDRIINIMDIFKLTQEEKDKLRKKYEISELGEEKYNNLHNLKNILARLSEKREEYLSMENPNNAVLYEISKEKEGLFDKEFLQLNNKTEVLSCIQKLMSYFEHKDRPTIYIKLNNLTEELYMNIKSFSNKKNEFDMNIIISLLKDNENLMNETFVFLNKTIGLMRQNASINCFYSKTKEKIGQEANNWIVSDDIFIQFSYDMSLGMASTDKEWIDFFRTEFNNYRTESTEICIVKCEPLTYISHNLKSKNSVRVIEHMPCFSFSLNEKILENSIYKEIPYRDELIKGILKNFRDYALEALDEFVSIFEKSGVIEFMNTGKVDVFLYGIYAPIPIEDRCNMLKYLIDYIEQREEKKIFAIKEGLTDLKGIHLEMRKHDNQLTSALFEIHFDEEKNEQIELTDVNCRRACWEFYEQLIQFGYVYSEKETIAWMKEVLEEYKIKLHVYKDN